MWSVWWWLWMFEMSGSSFWFHWKIYSSYLRLLLAYIRRISNWITYLSSQIPKISRRFDDFLKIYTCKMNLTLKRALKYTKIEKILDISFVILPSLNHHVKKFVIRLPAAPILPKLKSENHWSGQRCNKVSHFVATTSLPRCIPKGTTKCVLVHYTFPEDLFFSLLFLYFVWCIETLRPIRVVHASMCEFNPPRFVYK